MSPRRTMPNVAPPIHRHRPPVQAAKPILHAERLTKTYGKGDLKFHALRDVTVSIRDGEYVAIIGPSGSGKSTLLQLIGGLDKPSKGRVFVRGRPLDSMSDAAQARFRAEEMGFVFQAFHLIPRTPAWRNVEIVTRFRRPVPARANRKHIAYSALKRVGLEGKETNKPNALSGGQRQRVAIARALANDPEIILADEPTGNLDSKSGEQVLGVLDRLHRAGKTIIIVTHDPKVAQRAQRVIEVRDGRVRDRNVPAAALHRAPIEDDEVREPRTGDTPPPPTTPAGPTAPAAHDGQGGSPRADGKPSAKARGRQSRITIRRSDG